MQQRVTLIFVRLCLRVWEGTREREREFRLELASLRLPLPLAAVLFSRVPAGRFAPDPSCQLLGLAASLTRRFNLLPEEQDDDGALRGRQEETSWSYSLQDLQQLGGVARAGISWILALRF